MRSSRDSPRRPTSASCQRTPVPDTRQREFLGRLLNTGFYLTVMTLDPRAQELAQAEFRKVTLYLDTNFLYAVLGVGGPTEAFGANRMLELCQQLGVSLRISPWTANELRTSIASSRQDVEKFTRSKKTAAVMAQVSAEKGFESAYWSEARTTGTDPDTFFGKFDHFQRFLDHYGIEEHPEGIADVEAELSRIRDYTSRLRGRTGLGRKTASSASARSWSRPHVACTPGHAALRAVAGSTAGAALDSQRKQVPLRQEVVRWPFRCPPASLLTRCASSSRCLAQRR
ncbi:MAG: hypothetical protein JO156_04090 [Solirubrobacterales bacterium]|nr:hypothetical protein [Solirubrobacterales bacterium]